MAPINHGERSHNLGVGCFAVVGVGAHSRFRSGSREALGRRSALMGSCLSLLRSIRPRPVVWPTWIQLAATIASTGKALRINQSFQQERAIAILSFPVAG